MPVPVPLKISADTGAPGPVGYHIEGDSVPVLQVELNGTSIYFDHYVLLWKDPLVHIELKPQTKHLHRMRSGAPVFLTEARGPGHLALGRNGAGRAFALPLRAGQSIEVHEHQFIAATDGVEFTCKKIKGPATMLFGGTSFNVETFRSVQDSGIMRIAVNSSGAQMACVDEAGEILTILDRTNGARVGTLEHRGAVRSLAYDLVLNGIELGSGSVRIHNPELQSRIFTLLGIEPDIAAERFGFLLDAFRYGAPPHAGFAVGLDRLTMILTGESSIRDVIAFPKTQKAQCSMTDAPSAVDPAQLKELRIKLDSVE